MPAHKKEALKMKKDRIKEKKRQKHVRKHPTLKNVDVESLKVIKEIVIPHQLKQLRTNPHANISISGKKRRKLLKSSRRVQRNHQKMEVETVPKKNEKSKPSTFVDVEMKEVA